MKLQKTIFKRQINYKLQIINIQTSRSFGIEILRIGIYLYFVFCYLEFGVLVQVLKQLTHNL